jgi:glycine/sarcosine N-methyltransferase
MMVDSVRQFYDRLAGEYHLIFADWRQAVRWQGEVLDRLIRAEVGTAPLSVLDCSCGIGTQAIGLAARGYRVHATDLSPAAVERAAREAEALGVSLTVGVADLRALESLIAGAFDVVLSCDNALPHLLSDGDVRLAVRNMAAKLRPGGLLLISLRDYDQVAVERPRSTLPRVFDDPEGRRVVFQVWDWSADGRTYTVRQFILRHTDAGWQTDEYATVYRPLRRDELGQILREAGFTQIRWHLPDDSGYYQPIVTARKSADI